MEALGSRMKENYELRFRNKLMRRTPVIIRVDGKSFHTLTKKCHKPFDINFINSMTLTALELCKEIQGAKLAYVQSDEISILLNDYDRFNTEAWFDYNLEKIVSISAAIASVTFTRCFSNYGYFDSRAFNIPREEVQNYFIWRQKDWERNSLNMFAQSFFSHNQLHNKNKADIHEMLHSINQNWSSLSGELKNGSLIFKSSERNYWEILEAPDFMEDRFFISNAIKQVEE